MNCGVERVLVYAFRAGICCMALMVAGCSVVYEFAPIEAWVVDAETGKPIEGASVTANWELVKGSLDGPRYHSQLHVQETETDKNGRFAFPGFSKEDSSGAELRESDPQILIFKAGYEYVRSTNDYRDGGAGMRKVRRTAAVNGKTVKLRKLKLEYSSLPTTAYRGLHLWYRNVIKDCHWKETPKAMVAMDNEYKRLKAAHPAVFVHLVDSSTIRALADKCGSPGNLFEGR